MQPQCRDFFLEYQGMITVAIFLVMRVTVHSIIRSCQNQNPSTAHIRNHKSCCSSQQSKFARSKPHKSNHAHGGITFGGPDNALKRQVVRTKLKEKWKREIEINTMISLAADSGE